jgi:hypothetical protein
LGVELQRLLVREGGAFAAGRALIVGHGDPILVMQGVS